MRVCRGRRWGVIAAVAVIVTLLVMMSGCPEGALVVSAEGDGDGGGNNGSIDMPSFIEVPGGTFQRDETDTNTTTVSAFYMSVHQITRAQFHAIMGTDPSNTSYSSGMDDPVQMVNWYQAIAFCNKLSIAAGKQMVYDVDGVEWATLEYENIPTNGDANWNEATMDMGANGCRLPTEAEWRWAAMGAEQDAQPGAMQGGINGTGYQKPFTGYNGSNTIGEYAVFGYDYDWEDGRTTTERTNRVGSKLPNELGLYDMSGNVWEWTWDWVADYEPDHLDDPTGPSSGWGRIGAGGSWKNPASNCEITLRGANLPRIQDPMHGFRIVFR